MRLKKVLLSILFVFSIFLTANIYASTKTYERSKSDLKVNSRINVTSSNMNKILATPSVDATEKVYDFANLLTEDEEKKLYNSIQEFILKYDMDMVIVTIDDNNKSSAMNYADDFYDYNEFGTNSTHDGILFLIDMDNRKMWISTTGKAILYYSDSRIDSILDSTYSYITNKNYYMCANAFINRSSSYAASGIPSSNNNYTIDENGNYIRTGSSDEYVFSGETVIIIFVCCIFGSLIFLFVNLAKHKTIAKATTAKKYVVKDSFKLTGQTDTFLTTHTSKVYSPQSSSSSGGSSTHSGSSGISHGGGGRSF